MLDLLMSLVRRISNRLAARAHTGTLVGGECRLPCAFICAVTTVARATIAKPKTGGTRMHPWWTKEYKALRTHTSCLYDIFIKDKTQDSFQVFKKARNDKNKTKRRHKKQSYQADADKLQAIWQEAPGSKLAWDAAKRLRKQRAAAQVRPDQDILKVHVPDGTTISAATDVRDIFKTHHAKLATAEKLMQWTASTWTTTSTSCIVSMSGVL